MRYTPEETYKKFNERLVTTDYELLGVRVPIIRKMAKDIIKADEWQDVLFEKPIYHEDMQLQSYILSSAPMSIEERQQRLEGFLPLMDNWQVVDGLCSSIKEVKKYPEEYWEWLLTLRGIHEPFIIRFVVVMYLVYYLDSKHLDDVLAYFESIENDHYYVKMAIAWALSIAYIKNEERLTKFFAQTQLDKWTYNKALQKITESRQITANQKVIVRSWKK